MDLFVKKSFLCQKRPTNDLGDPPVGEVKNPKWLKRVRRIPIWSIKFVSSDKTSIKILVLV